MQSLCSYSQALRDNDTVYQALALLRDAKVIETRIDDADGERKNFLVKPQEQGK